MLTSHKFITPRRKLVAKFTVCLNWHGETRCILFKEKKICPGIREQTKESAHFLTNKKNDQMQNPKIMKHECRADLDDNRIRELNRQIESQPMEIGHTFARYEQSRREQALLHEESAERERALRETRIRSVQEMEEMKRVQELRVDDFSRGKLVENQDTINERTARIQELQNEVNCMNDSREFSRCRTYSQWTIIPRSQSTSVISTPSRITKNAQPRSKFAARYVESAWYIGKRFCWSMCECFDALCRNAPFLGLLLAKTGKPVAESGDQSQDHPYSEISAKTVSQKFVQPYGGKIFKELWGRPIKTSNLVPSL